MKRKIDNKVKEDNNIVCPLCGSHRSLPCYRERVLDVDYSQDKSSTHIEQYLICDNCGLIYVYPRPSADVLQKYYASIPVSQISSKVLNDYKKPEYERTVNFVMTNTGLDHGRIVDVGAASGNLLYRFGSRINNTHLIGIETSKECCDFAKEHYDIEMIQGQFEDIDFIEYGLVESADLVLCCHTLEHTIDPARFLRYLSLIVKSSGFLYIEVPSTQILATFRDPRYGRNIHHLHLNHFLASNLSLACEKLGLFPVIVSDDIGTNYPSLKAPFIKQTPAERAKKLFLQQTCLLDDTFKQIKHIIAAVLDASDKRVVLWGVGQDLFYILQKNSEILSPYHVILVDKNPYKQGKNFFGLKVHNPENVDWSQIGHILITPSNQMLQLHIKEDIEKMCLNHIKFSFIFPVKNQKSYLEGTI